MDWVVCKVLRQVLHSFGVEVVLTMPQQEWEHLKGGRIASEFVGHWSQLELSELGRFYDNFHNDFGRLVGWSDGWLSSFALPCEVEGIRLPAVVGQSLHGME